MLCVPCFCLVCWTNGGQSDRSKKTVSESHVLRKCEKKIQQTPDTELARCIGLFSWSTYCLFTPHQKWPGRGAVKKPFLRKGNRKRAAVCQIIQEPDWSSGLTEEVQRRSGERYDCEGLEPPEKHGVCHGLGLISAIGAKFNRIINAKRNHLILIYHTIPPWKTKNLPG